MVVVVVVAVSVVAVELGLRILLVCGILLLVHAGEVVGGVWRGEG